MVRLHDCSLRGEECPEQSMIAGPISKRRSLIKPGHRPVLRELWNSRIRKTNSAYIGILQVLDSGLQSRDAVTRDFKSQIAVSAREGIKKGRKRFLGDAEVVHSWFFVIQRNRR